MVTLVDNGLKQAIKRLVGVPANPQKWVQVGEGTADEDITQTGLDIPIDEHGLGRVEGSSYFEEPNIGAVTATLGPNTSGGVIEVWEAGLFDVDGIMSLRHKYATARVLDPGDSIEITFKNMTVRQGVE